MKTLINVIQFFYFCIYWWTVEEAEAKAATSPQICCHTTSRNLNVQLYNLALMWHQPNSIMQHQTLILSQYWKSGTTF